MLQINLDTEYYVAILLDIKSYQKNFVDADSQI